MAASTSRQPHNIPLPHSPAATVKLNKAASKKSKGKGKEQTGLTRKRRVVQASSGSNPWDTSETESTWNWMSLTDSSASKFPPIFTKDGSYFFSLVGSSVKIHSVATGQVVSTLSAPRPAVNGASSDLLTSAILNPHNAFQLITGSLNGCLMVWDFLDATLLQIIDIAQPVYHICAHDKFKDSVFVAASRPSKNKTTTDDNAVVLRVSLKPTPASAQFRVQKSSEVSLIAKTRFPTGLAFSSSGAWLVAVAGHKAYVARTSSLKTGFTKYVSPERLTCLAFHPSEEYFATGDDKGNIRLWYCLNEHITMNAVGVEKKAQTTALHWHAHAVSSIAFTSNGAYLLSGGEESVLVLWQLHTGKKEFVPRVGSPINTVALSKVGDGEEEYLLGLADATYVFVSAGTLKISRSYARLKLDPATPHVWPSTSASVPLAVHSLTSTLILPSSHPSSLQTYSPSSSKLICELEVSPSNRVSRRDDKPMEPSKVERIVVTSSGEWMASIDSREGDDAFRGEIYLKMWWWDRKAGYWILNTRIDRPHGLKKVTALAFSPVVNDHQLLLVTTGDDGNVKSWGIRTMKHKTGTSEAFWVARSTFSFRSEIPTYASWSPDGSLLAISIGPYVAVYDPLTNTLRQTLTSPECKAITSAHFVGRGGRFLAVVGVKDLLLWDLVAQCVRWHHKSSWELDTVLSHPVADLFALFHRPSSSTNERQQTRISVFRTSSSIPFALHSVPFGLQNVIWYSAPSTSSESLSLSLVGITHTWSVVLLGDNIRLPEEEGSTAREIVGDFTPQKRTLFQDIFGKSALSHLSNDPSPPKPRPTMARPWTGQEAVGIFDGPAYLAPPLESLFETLIDTFLKTRSEDTDGTAGRNAEIEDEDVDMDEEGGGPVVVRTQLKRMVDRKEMDSFVDLFKLHTVQSKPPPPLFNISGNTNGTSKGTVNGSAHRSMSPFAVVAQKQNGIPVKQKGSIPGQSLPRATPSPTASSPSTTRTVNGRKRKKSSS